MSQSEFASAFGISVSTLRHWERGDRTPQGPALVLLNVVAKEPDFGRLHAASAPQDMNLPGLFFHQLNGKYRGQFSVRVMGIGELLLNQQAELELVLFHLFLTASRAAVCCDQFALLNVKLL